MDFMFNVSVAVAEEMCAFCDLAACNLSHFS